MKAKEICAKGFKSMLTIISPMLNTRVSQGVLYGASTCVG